MAVPLYPAGLPAPRLLDAQIVERRQLTKGDGPMLARPFQLGIVMRETLAFTFTFGQAEEFRAWWQDTLVRGGAWFGARWPTPEGMPEGGVGVRRFTKDPAWSEFIPGVGWSMTTETELRAVSAAPEPTEVVSEFDIGWLYNAHYYGWYDPTTASTENAVNEPYGWDTQPVYGALVNNPGDRQTEFYVDSWEPLVPGGPEPDLQNDPQNTGQGTFFVEFRWVYQYDDETGYLIGAYFSGGTARIRARVHDSAGLFQEVAGQYLEVTAAEAEGGYYGAIEFFHGRDV